MLIPSIAPLSFLPNKGELSFTCKDRHLAIVSLNLSLVLPHKDDLTSPAFLSRNAINAMKQELAAAQAQFHLGETQEQMQKRMEICHQAAAFVRLYKEADTIVDHNIGVVATTLAVSGYELSNADQSITVRPSTSSSYIAFLFAHLEQKRLRVLEQLAQCLSHRRTVEHQLSEFEVSLVQWCFFESSNVLCGGQIFHNWVADTQRLVQIIRAATVPLKTRAQFIVDLFVKDLMAEGWKTRPLVAATGSLQPAVIKKLHQLQDIMTGSECGTEDDVASASGICWSGESLYLKCSLTAKIIRLRIDLRLAGIALAGVADATLPAPSWRSDCTRLQTVIANLVREGQNLISRQHDGEWARECVPWYFTASVICHKASAVWLEKESQIYNPESRGYKEYKSNLRKSQRSFQRVQKEREQYDLHVAKVFLESGELGQGVLGHVPMQYSTSDNAYQAHNRRHRHFIVRHFDIFCPSPVGTHE